MDEERDGPSPRASIPEAFGHLADSALALVRTRAELAAVEFEEQRVRVVRSAIHLAGAVFMLAFAVLGVAAWIVAYFWDTHPLAAIAGVTIAFALAGAGLIARNAADTRAAPMPFAATIAELEKDREWLAGHGDRSTKP